MNLSRRKLGMVASVATMVAGVVAGGGAVAQAQTPASSASSASAGHITPFAGLFTPIRNVGDNLCLQPTALGPNTPVVQVPCDGSTAQGWLATWDSNGARFINQASGLCLNAFTGAVDGALVGIDTCRNISNQRFDTAALPNVTAIESRIGWQNNGFCIDVPGASSAPGLQVQLWNCNGTLAQRWVVGFA